MRKWEVIDGVKKKCNPMNLPTQTDVLVSSLTHQKSFDHCGLLTKALGRGHGVSASNIDIKWEQAKGLLVPWVPCPDKSPYHPPRPKACWKFAGFEVLENGQVACKCNKEAKRILSQYALIHFLQERYREGFQA